MSATTVQYQLEIKGINKILIPGCEPTSALSSKTLSAYMAAGKSCKNALIDLKTALAAIPGSYVKYGINFVTVVAAVEWHRLLHRFKG